jgi:6-phosphogluconolactonase (cycloisomerase 2 family)
VYVYVVEQATTNSGEILEFQSNTSTGALTAIGSMVAGVNPSAITTEPTGRFVYITDKTSNQIYGYQLNTGVLSALSSNPTATGLYPVAMAVDPRGEYLYVANYNSNSVSGFLINHGTGALTGIATSFSTATGPTCVTIDPSLGIFLFTSDYLGNYISGAELKSETGTLTNIANTPFPTGPLPSCITSVANGSHAQSIVNPN